MGFIERLRRQMEEETRLSRERAEQERLKAQRLREEEDAANRLKMSAIIEQKENVKKDLEQARSYFLQSDFPKLLKDLANLLPNSIIQTLSAKEFSHIPHPWDWSNEEITEGKHLYTSDNNYPAFEGVDSELALPVLDNIVDLYFESQLPRKIGVMFTWFAGDTDRVQGSHTLVTWYSRYNTIPITCDSSGVISLGIRKIDKRFFGDQLSREIILPANIWANDHQVQDQKLEEAFINPRFFLIFHSQGWDGSRGEITDPSMGL
jgi:hypothetical protein